MSNNKDGDFWCCMTIFIWISYKYITLGFHSKSNDKPISILQSSPHSFNSAVVSKILPRLTIFFQSFQCFSNPSIMRIITTTFTFQYVFTYNVYTFVKILLSFQRCIVLDSNKLYLLYDLIFRFGLGDCFEVSDKFILFIQYGRF